LPTPESVKTPSPKEIAMQIHYERALLRGRVTGSHVIDDSSSRSYSSAELKADSSGATRDNGLVKDRATSWSQLRRREKNPEHKSSPRHEDRFSEGRAQ